MGTIVEISHLFKTYQTDQGTVQAVDDVSINVEQGSFLTLLGPSGCGKTTTLRCLAGLEAPDAGEISIEGQTVVSVSRKISVPPNKRAIGMVFQSYAIWPHMNVFENVAFPLIQLKPRPSRQRIRERVLHALEQVRLGGLEKRPAPQLSGGQQQRLALARALVKEPRVLLLDEPLSNLDAKLREEMRVELKELTRKLSITSIYVTHDQSEALALSDMIAVMNRGKIVQIGPPKSIYVEPSCKFVASFIGNSNLIEGTAETCPPSKAARIRTALGLFDSNLPTQAKPGERVYILGRPEDFEIIPGSHPEENHFTGEVKVLLFMGDSLECRVAVKDSILHLRLPAGAAIAVGDTVCFRLAPESCRILPLNEVVAS